MTSSPNCVIVECLTSGWVTLTAGVCIDGSAWNLLHRKECSTAVSLLWVLHQGRLLFILYLRCCSTSFLSLCTPTGRGDEGRIWNYPKFILCAHVWLSLCFLCNKSKLLFNEDYISAWTSVFWEHWNFCWFYIFFRWSVLCIFALWSSNVNKFTKPSWHSIISKI